LWISKAMSHNDNQRKKKGTKTTRASYINFSPLDFYVILPKKSVIRASREDVQ
jgi:hypothetical protein